MCSVIKFPKAKKRGPKVSRGPLADVIRLPLLLQGDELTALWVWLQDNHKRWDNDATVGHDPDWQRKLGTASVMAYLRSRAPLTEARMRAEVSAWQKRIESRSRAKEWLRSLGAPEAERPEEAFFFLYDRIAASSSPSAA